MVYISSNSWLLADGSRDLSQALEVTVAKPEQIHKMTIIFTQNGQKLSFLKFAWLWQHLKFVFSKKATKLDEIFTVDLTLTT